METKESSKKLNLLIVGLLLSILAASMDNTIVATAMGTIVSEIGGLDQFVWVTSAYMVASMASMPIFGKLSDMFGRKRFFIFGLGLFLIGSILCGTADGIIQLSIYRAIQGIGGGALLPIAFTIIFDAFPVEKRGKMTAIIGATFGISSVFGPLLGSFITENLGWRWIFYINMPIGAMALLLVILSYKESKEKIKQKIDFGGAITLVLSVVSFMFAIELGGEKYAWDSTQIISLFSIFAIMFILFIIFERKASEPIINFALFKNKLFASSQALAFIYGAAFISLTVFIPIFVQAVNGGTATNAGLILMPMMIGSVVGSGIAGGFQNKTTFRALMSFSIVAFIAGLFLLSTIDVETSKNILYLFMFITGLGVGFSFSLLPTSTMHNLDPNQRGSASSTNAFFRSLGMTIGITIWGSVQNNSFTNYLSEKFGSSSQMNMETNDLSSLFSGEERKAIPENILNTILEGFSSSISVVFLYCAFVAIVAIPFVIMMGKERTIPKK